MASWLFPPAPVGEDPDQWCQKNVLCRWYAVASTLASTMAAEGALHLPALLAAAFLALAAAVVAWRRLRSGGQAVKEFVAPGEGPRFRKRDRLAFLSRRAIRNAKAVGSYIRGGQGRKRRDVSRYVYRVCDTVISVHSYTYILF